MTSRKIYNFIYFRVVNDENPVILFNRLLFERKFIVRSIVTERTISTINAFFVVLILIFGFPKWFSKYILLTKIFE